MAKISLLVGSVYGGAEAVAQQLQSALDQAGHQASISDAQTATSLVSEAADAWLVVTSTTGSGDIPDTILPLFLSLQSEFPMLSDLKYGVVALGDSSYGDTFCGGGRQFGQLLEELGAKELCPLLTIDACEHFDGAPVALEWLPNWLTQLQQQTTKV